MTAKMQNTEAYAYYGSQGEPPKGALNLAPAELLQSLEEYNDTVAWINDLIDDHAAEEDQEHAPAPYDLAELERRVSQLSATLDVVCEDTSNQVERTIEEVSRTVPRLTYDLHFMRENALSLQAALTNVESKSRSSIGSDESVKVLERLHYLDTVKRNMAASLEVLKEAESWSTLESEVMSLLREQSYTRSAARLSEASKSLSVFQNTPDYESRKSLMVSLQNQLEASLSSALVSAISSGDIDACKKYFDIFCHIERESEFRSYWNGSKRKGIVAAWEQTSLQDCGESSTEGSRLTDKKLSVFLHEFYDYLFALIQAERGTVVSVFPDPQVTLSTFVATTLTSLQPPLTQRLGGLVNRYDGLVLSELIAAYKTTQEFAVAMDKIMEKVGYSALSPALVTTPLDENSPAPQTTHSRRRSHRQSFSRRLSARGMSISGVNPLGVSANQLDQSWSEALFEPFLDYQSDYSALEKRLMKEQLRKLSAYTDPRADSGRLLRERAVDVFTILDDALARCMAFTHGFGAAGLVQAIDDFFDSFMESSRTEMLDTTKSTSSVVGGVRNAPAMGEDFADLDYSAADYTAFQLSLHLLEAARGIFDRLLVFESKLRAQLQQTAGALRMMRNDPLGLYFSGTTRAAIDLLQGSVLNSVELQSLLDSVDPEAQNIHPQTPFTPSTAGLGSHKPHSAQSQVIVVQGARDAVIGFARACQARLQETILAPLYKHLSTYAGQQAWSTPDSGAAKSGGATGATSEIAIPQFSLSPTQTIQRVAEGLLSLPRLFEVYADDDALSFSVETLPFIDADMLKNAHTEGIQDTQEPSKADGMNEGRPRQRHLASPSMTLKLLPTPAPTAIALTPEAVTSAWLASLALSLLSHLTTKILPSIKSLSKGGSAQLAEDLGYLNQIVKALNVQWQPLEKWRELVDLEEDEWKVKVKEVRETAKDGDWGLFLSVARVKGWSVTGLQ